METGKKKENNLHTLSLGIVMIVLDSFWLLFYLYPFVDKGYNFDNLDFIAAINILGALVSITLATRVIRMNSSAWTAVPINLGLFCLCLLIGTLMT